MNSLSWFLYFADVCGNFQALFGIGAFALMSAALFLTMGATIEGEPALFGYARKSLIGGVVLAIFCTLVPGSKTLHMIAASEIGDRLSKTQAANEIASEANDILRGYLKKLKAGLGEEKQK